MRKYIAPALPPADRTLVANEYALVPVTAHSDKAADMDLIYHSLLDLKHEVSDLKRYMHVMALRLDDLKEDRENLQPETYHNHQDIPLYEEDNMSLADMERKMIASALQKHNGNRRMASVALGISERTLYRKIQDYNLE